MGSEWEIVNLGGCAVDVREYPQIGGEFRQQIFLTRSREAAKPRRKKIFMTFPHLRLRKILRRRNSDFFAFFAFFA
jgi:hypothetical protein